MYVSGRCVVPFLYIKGGIDVEKVAIIMGSDSDWPILESGYLTLKEFGIEVEVLVASAHRTPDIVQKFVQNAESNGFSVLIAAAGAAAHLPGVIAAFTTLPVVGIPISGSALKGMDALLSIVQMPSGIPVGTMAIDGGKNAALYALSILGIKNSEIAKKLKAFREEQAQAVVNKNLALQKKL